MSQAAQVTLDYGQARRFLLDDAADLVRAVGAERIREKAKEVGFTFRQDTPTPLPRHYTVREYADKIAQDAANLVLRFPELQPFAEGLGRVLRQTLGSSKDMRVLLGAFYELLDLRNDWLHPLSAPARSHFTAAADGRRIVLRIGRAVAPEGDPKEVRPAEFVRAVTRMNEILRKAARRPSRDEALALALARGFVINGVALEHPYRAWATSGFRDTQTLASLTDPGEEGHLNGTSADRANLRGVIVHIEHLERDGHQDRTLTEPYRIPAIATVAQVRLQIGADAPCSSYVGRPLFEGGFEAGLLKALHTVAAACSALFALGMAECKVAIENMTARQAIRFMQHLAAAVIRDRHSQVLSAAFNINTPILDDRREDGDPPVMVTDRKAIGLLGIELAKVGSFEKVTWDGAGNFVPSLCILEQLGYPAALELVHRAHELGLLTYFSAGFRFHHLPEAVFTGVDGVGIGGVQILRFYDKQTGFHGPFKPENIREILRIRDEAAESWQGQAAWLLARLDRLHFEGFLTAAEEIRRRELFEALRQGDEMVCRRVMEKLEDIRALPAEGGEHPVLARGRRLLAAADRDPLLARRLGPAAWSALLETLQRCLDEGDVALLAEELSNLVVPDSRLFLAEGAADGPSEMVLVERARAAIRTRGAVRWARAA